MRKLLLWFLGSLIGWNLIACAPPVEIPASQQTQVDVVDRTAVEHLLLSATVRVQIETWLVNENEQGYTILQAEGHGTVVNGRFLITHNHHNIPLSLTAVGIDPDIYTRLIVYNAAGEMVNVLPLTDFQIAHSETQTLLLAYTGDNFELPFGTVGLAPNQIKAWTAVPLHPNTEVAQINWDGAVTTVEWTEISAVRAEREPPCVELANQTVVGASGGAVFWNGYHIGNNWLNGTKSSQHSQPHQYSLAAMNSTDLVAFFHQVSP